MAYGLLLYKEIEAPEGLHRLEIWKDGYAGDGIEIDGLVRDSIHISKNAGDACDAITTSVLTFSLYDTGQLDYSQFFTPNAVLFKVIWKMNGSARWTGYLTPDSYSENLSYRDTITLTARDNLGRLNDYDFNLARGQMMTVRSLIVQGLTVAGVAMDTVFVTTKVASSPETTLAIDGLVNTSLLVGSTWHEALTLLLEGLGLTLSWNDGNKFEVRDITQAPSASQSAFFISKSGYRQIRPAWKNLTASQDYGLRDNFYEGQLTEGDCGDTVLFTPPAESRWPATGTFFMMNPYKGAPNPLETLYIPIKGGDAVTDYITYTFLAPVTERAVKIQMRCNNTAWVWQEPADYFGYVGIADRPTMITGMRGQLYEETNYYIRFRCNVFLNANGTRYVLRQGWEEYNPSSMANPYLYFIMPAVRDEYGNIIALDADNDVSLYISRIPIAGEIELVLYPASLQTKEDGEPTEIAKASVGGGRVDAYAKIDGIEMSIDDGIEGRANLITINEAHNVQSNFSASIGEVPEGRGNALLYLGGLFYDDDYYTPLKGFKRDANGYSYDLLELVAREHITHNNAAYNALSGTMKAEDAFRFDRAIAFEGTEYRIIAASLAVLSNTLSVQFLQQEADFADADYAITVVDSEGNTSSRGGTGGIGQGTTPSASQENILVLTEGLAKAYARITSLEDWLRDPWLDELNATALNSQTVDVGTLLTVDGAANIAGLLTASGELKVTGTSKKIWLGDNVYIELDANGYIHTNGAFYSDNFISAGGLGEGGGGTGGLDLGAMWTSLCNTTVPTSAVNANTKIAVAHIPDITTAKISDLSTWWTTQRASLNLGAAASKGIGTVTDGNTDLVTGDSVYDFVMAAIDSEALENNIAEGLANLAARAASLEDWLRDPWLDELNATALNSQTVDVGTLLTVDGAANIAGLLTASGELKVTGSSKKIWLGDNVYIELDADGYLHTNAPLYSDEWISAGGVEAGGGGGVDIGAVWQTLTNDPSFRTEDYTSTTKIALAHLPYTAGAGVSISNAGAVSLALSGVAAGTYAAVTVDAYGRVTSGSAPAALTFGSKSYDGTVAQTLTAADLGALTSTYTLTINNSGGAAVLTYNPASAAASLTLTKAMVGLSNVENVALSTWYGSTYIRTVGTITYGAWHGSPIGNAYLENSTITLAGTAVSLGGSLTAAQLRSLLSINNVENTALSTWGGSTYINTVGTITTGTWHGSRIENGYLVHNKVTIAGVDVSLGGSIADYTLLSALGLTSAASDISTLSSYFTNGIANQATRLSGSYTRSAWGQTFWSNGQPASISGAMTGVDSINGFLFITNSNGRLGVGTSQPSSTLHVAGGAYITSSIITDSYIYIGGTSAYIRNDGGYLRTNVGFAADGFISAGGVSSSSDARLKKNLNDIALTVHDIAAAPAVSFDWIDDRGSSAGSIAQYWQPLLPDNVRAWEVDGFLSMEYGNIALLAAITIARAVESQEQKIARLEARVQELENQLLKH